MGAIILPVFGCPGVVLPWMSPSLAISIAEKASISKNLRRLIGGVASKPMTAIRSDGKSWDACAAYAP